LWLCAITDVVNIAPIELRKDVIISKEIITLDVKETLKKINSKTAFIDNSIKGYLFKRGEKHISGLGSEDFKKRYFVLKELKLSYYKTVEEYKGSSLPIGIVDLNEVNEVRETVDSNAPQNSFEIVTPARVYLFVAEDEESLILWLDSLLDTLEIRKGGVNTIINKENFNTDEVDSNERNESIRKSILFSSNVLMKSVNSFTGIATWKERYFAFLNGSIVVYDHEADLYDPDKEVLYDIGYSSILNVESSAEPKCSSHCALDFKARSLVNGDADGLKIFTLNAK
jgi:hypothetical protein